MHLELCTQSREHLRQSREGWSVALVVHAVDLVETCLNGREFAAEVLVVSADDMTDQFAERSGVPIRVGFRISLCSRIQFPLDSLRIVTLLLANLGKRPFPATTMVDYKLLKNADCRK